MTYRFINPIGRYRAAYASRTEPESATLISRLVWRVLLVCMGCFMGGAVAFSIIDLSTTLAVLDQDGGSSRTKTPALDRVRLSSVAQQERTAMERFLEEKANPATEIDPSH